MKSIKGYELIQEYDLKDINSKGYLFSHIKTGARVAVVSNDDNNKVFSIGFRTPPKDSTGAPHIVEHTVLCGSRKFKAKDPFVELVKGSLNTFLNAMTYPDKTVYPVASCNQKDFENLMDVYLDSVFYPNIYNEEKIFMQEGWHYELEDADAPLTYNGVVYNEMKGAFSSPEQVLYRNISTALFPDTTYATESGGDPQVIPELTYEQFLDFHKRYYHPSNSYIYLYGDVDVKERLEWMDREYLDAFEKQQVDSEIKLQEPFSEMSIYEKSYPVSEESEDDDKTYLSYSTSFGLSTDSQLCIAFEVLSYLLVDAPGARLKQALLDAGYGRDILCDFESEIRQPVFSIIAKDSKPEFKDEFVKKIKEELSAQVEEGFDEDTITAALSKLEFKYREADYDSYPKGLIYGLDMYAGWLYDDSLPFATMQLNDVYESLRSKIGTGYFEKLVKDYLIDNTHLSIIVISPDKELGRKNEEELTSKLQAYKDSLSADEINEIIEKTKQLRQYQEEGSTKEELATIPQLKRSDISKNPLKIDNEKLCMAGNDVIWHDIFTNNIIYADMYFDMNNIRKELTPYLGLYTTALGYFSTDKHSYLELSNIANMYTGGISFNALPLSKSDKMDDVDYKFKVSVRFLYGYAKQAFELLTEVINDTNFNDEKHLLEVIRESRSRMQMKLNSASHSAAIKRCDSYYSQAGMFMEQTSGIEYYEFLKNAENNFEIEKGKIIAAFNTLTKMIFLKNNVILSLTCDTEGKGIVEKHFGQLIDALPENESADANFVIDNYKTSCVTESNEFILEQKNEGFMFAGQVQYVARTGLFDWDADNKNIGAFNVLKTVLGYGYLWEKVRVSGGAYGCMVNFSRNGQTYFVSYRDPKLEKTNEVFEGVPEYVENFTEPEEEMTKYVIGTIGRLDTPMNPAAKGARDFALYYAGLTYDDLFKARSEVINVTVDDIRSLAPYIRKVLDQKNICTIGNEARIKEAKDMFGQVKTLS